MLSRLGEGLKQYLLTAFWHYLLLLEIVNKLVEWKARSAHESPRNLAEFNELQSHREKHGAGEGDFSERLMALVNRVIERFPTNPPQDISSDDVTHSIYTEDIRVLSDLVAKQLDGTEELWILFDNIDKGFRSHGLEPTDVLIVRCLLEATRKLQRALEKRRIDCVSIVLIRRDVFDLLVDTTPDRGKESCANLDWSDVELVKELLLKRFRYVVPELEGSFEDVWRRLVDPHVAGESSFSYILSRTFLRPRDILNFVRKCINVAVSRDHDRVEQEDIRIAEKEFSEDMLNELWYEIRDVLPETPDLLLEFLGTQCAITRDEVHFALLEAGVVEDQLDRTRDLLIWFSFLGVRSGDEERYAYQFQHNVSKLRILEKQSDSEARVYVVHPAFRTALEV